ncbi:class F sortase, partial [Bacillus sp. S34]|nr:class F sortase [Bacillus sp. S34]
MGATLADRDNGTVFVVMHSLRGGATGPGNYLIDVDAQRSDVVAGSVVHMGDATYT